LAEHLSADFPQLDAVARASGADIPVIVDETSLLARAVFADPPLLAMFDLPMLDAATSRTEALLSAPGSAIVSQSFARRLFGTDKVVGRTLRWRRAERRDVRHGRRGRSSSRLAEHGHVRGRLPFGLRFEILVSSDMDGRNAPPRGPVSRLRTCCCRATLAHGRRARRRLDSFGDATSRPTAPRSSGSTLGP
jgi:hypothetical protein